MRLLTFLSLLLFAACTSGTDTTTVAADEPGPQGQGETRQEVLSSDPNPPAEGFNAKASDQIAIDLADSVVVAYGGRRAYDNTRYFRWDFFGIRTLYWDKQAGRVRIESPRDNRVYLLDYSGEELSGRVRDKGNEITDSTALREALQQAYSIWINDSYWLVQPFKLKDSGVTLKLIGDNALDPVVNRPSYQLQQTFEEVGDTPGNRYVLWIDKVTNRINTWQFFRSAEDEEPAMQTPYAGVAPYNGILLSGDRGEYSLGNIYAGNRMEERFFSDF